MNIVSMFAPTSKSNTPKRKTNTSAIVDIKSLLKFIIENMKIGMSKIVTAMNNATSLIVILVMRIILGFEKE